jgi:hypothetical protein
MVWRHSSLDLDSSAESLKVQDFYGENPIMASYRVLAGDRQILYTPQELSRCYLCHLLIKSSIRTDITESYQRNTTDHTWQCIYRLKKKDHETFQ